MCSSSMLKWSCHFILTTLLVPLYHSATRGLVNGADTPESLNTSSFHMSFGILDTNFNIVVIQPISLIRAIWQLTIAKQPFSIFPMTNFLATAVSSLLRPMTLTFHLPQPIPNSRFLRFGLMSLCLCGAMKPLPVTGSRHSVKAQITASISFCN